MTRTEALTSNIGVDDIGVDEGEKSESLSDEQMGDLVSAVGNNEAKALTLIAMGIGGIFTANRLHHSVMALQGENPGWAINSSMPFNYCAQSLAPIGLVAKEFQYPVWGYAITPMGRDVGVPLAGLLLGFSEKYGLPLSRIFGATHSSSFPKQTEENEKLENPEYKKRSPATTIKILYELATAPDLPIREIDLMARIAEIAPIVRGALERLSKLGLISFDSTSANTPFSYYKRVSPPPNSEMPPHKRGRSMIEAVLLVFLKHPEGYLSAKDVVDLLPEELKEGRRNKKRLNNEISSILSHLKRNGFVEIKKFDEEKQSEINLTTGQRNMLVELMLIIDGVQNKDPKVLAEGLGLANEIVSDPQRTANLMKRAKEASSNANKTPPEQTQKDILSIISSHPGITRRDVQKYLGLNGKSLSRDRIGQLMLTLEQQGLISVAKNGKVKTLFPKTEE